MNLTDTAAAPATPARPEPHPESGYNVPLGNLRGALTALVVAHHAVLAYHPWAPPAPQSLLAQPRFWEMFPVWDAHRWSGWAYFVSFNDVFFMALMFFLSGLFVWDSLERKGGARFIRERAVRLGVPFLALAAVLAPAAYAPAYLQSASRAAAGFWAQWLHLGEWPAGPAWFLWLLLAFGLAAAGVHAIRPRAAVWSGETAGRLLRSPFLCWAALVLLSAAAYVPLALRWSGMAWSGWGPFAFQTSRPLHYAVYFAAGAVVGGTGIGRTFLAGGGPLARRWLAWVFAALAAFALATGLFVALLMHSAAGAGLAAASAASFSVSCAASSFAALALFVRFSRTQGRFIASFCAAAYGIYIVHYPVVSWIQYALADAPLAGVLKGAAATLASLAASWGLVAALRRWRRVAAVI